MAGPFSIQYSLALIKVRDGADKERVGRRRLVRVYLGWGRLCPAVPVPAGEGAALAHAADHEQEEEDQGGDGGHQDVQPALRPQLGPAAGEAREEQHVVIPVSAAQVIPTMHEGCIKKKQNCYNARPVSREVSEVLVVARVTVGRGGVTLAVKPAALQRRLLIPDADGAHLRWPQPPSRHNLTAELTCFDNDQRIMTSCGQCTVRLSFTEFPKLTNFVHWMNDLGSNPSRQPCEIPFMQRFHNYSIHRILYFRYKSSLSAWWVLLCHYGGNEWVARCDPGTRALCAWLSTRHVLGHYRVVRKNH